MEDKLCSRSFTPRCCSHVFIHWMGGLLQIPSHAIAHLARPKLFSGMTSHPFSTLKLTLMQINVVVLLGFMSFATSAFWLSLYMQNVLKFSSLTVAVHLLPQAIGGILVNVVAGLVMHKVNNKLLVGIGSLSYLGSVLLLANMKVDSSYWAFIFPSLLLSVIGADLQFNVANVSFVFFRYRGFLLWLG